MRKYFGKSEIRIGPESLISGTNYISDLYSIYEPNVVVFINGVTASVVVVVIVHIGFDDVIKGPSFLQVTFTSFGDEGTQLPSK